MPLLEALRERLNDAVAPMRPVALTHRDVTLPRVSGKAHAVIGMRRSGKTCFLKQLLAERRKSVPPERAIYLSFDDDRLADLDASQLDALLEEYFLRHPACRDGGACTWFLDEIQLVQGWERFVRRVLDNEPIDIVVSGSSAKMLSREIHTSLRGRAMATTIRPFSFREFLRHRGMEPAARVETLPTSGRRELERLVRDHLAIGGFPEAQGEPATDGAWRPLDRATRIVLLQGYVDTVLFRDVIERHAVTQVAALRWVIRQALRNPGGSFSASRMHADLKSQGFNIGKDAVHSLLDHLTDAFLITAVPVATESERRRNTNPRKLYPADTGLIEAFDASGRANTGHALETAVFNELARRGATVAYFKSPEGFEVDFVANHADGRVELLQVCASPAEPATWQRETRSLDAASREHPRAERTVIVLDTTSARSVTHPRTRILPAHEWLLEGR
jgi:predicted AAA+ superfamily ATPase